MFRSALCAVALSFLLVGCYEAKDPVHRHGILVKTCPNHRIFYTFQNKLYLKEDIDTLKVMTSTCAVRSQCSDLASQVSTRVSAAGS